MLRSGPRLRRVRSGVIALMAGPCLLAASCAGSPYSRSASAPARVSTTTPAPSPPATPTRAASATPVRSPAATPPPSATPTRASTEASGSLTLPIRAVFYYPWFPESWKQDGFYPFTNYHPTQCYFGSAFKCGARYQTLNVVAGQIRAMQYGGFQAGIASWWGQGSEADSRTPALLRAANGTGFKWALYYEAEGNSIAGVTASPNPSTGQITSDLAYIYRHYARNRSYLHVSGRPVIFAYGDSSDACSAVNDTPYRWYEANAAFARKSGTSGFYTDLKVFSGYTSCGYQPSSWHQYGPAVAEDSQPGYSFSISPGFWKCGETSPRLPRNLNTFERNVRDMLASKAPWQLVTTFNEWGEGTAVESALEWRSSSGQGLFLDVLHNDGSPVAGTLANARAC